MGEDKLIYAALLYASVEFPTEAGELALEFSQRRPLPKAVQAKINQARKQQQAERQELERDRPKRKTLPRPISVFSGKRAKPWPHGPSSRIDQDFVDTILDDNGFSALASKSPDVALEILLAICIDEPDYEELGHHTLPKIRLTRWHGGDPPIFSRGPFLPFLFAAPQEAITFTLTLLNFATNRWLDGQQIGLEFIVGGQKRLWLGEQNVFRWTLDWPVSDATTLITALMALEAWLYQQLDQGVDVTLVLDRLMRENESIALAAVLLNVGKKKPELFFGPLAPLIENWIIWEWDHSLSNLRSTGLGSLGYFGGGSRVVQEIAKNWSNMPHRKLSLIGLAATNWLATDDSATYLEGLRGRWIAANKKKPDQHLRQLIERINKANYSFSIKDGRLVPTGFAWPKGLKEENEAALKNLMREQQELQIPILCRQHLDQGAPLQQEEIAFLFNFIQDVHSNRKKSRGPDPLRSVSDIVLAGISVLVVFHYDWLLSERTALAWCRKRLEDVVTQPPSPRRFDNDTAVDKQQWDAFAAEAGVALLARNNDDWLARALTASAVLSFHYATTELVLRRAVHHREQLGQEFERIVNATLRWAALRSCLRLLDPQWQPEATNIHNQIDALRGTFVDKSLPPELPNIIALDDAALRDLDKLDRKRFPRSVRYKRGKENHRYVENGREKLKPAPVALDEHLVPIALSWISIDDKFLKRRHQSLVVLRELHSLVLSRLPVVEDRRHQRVEDYPTRLDGWVFGKLAQSIPHMTDEEKPSELWSDIIALGADLHDWVEAFLGSWFSAGAKNAKDSARFIQLWRAMIDQALLSPRWDPATNFQHDLSTIVIDLLGLHAYRRWYEVPSLIPYAEEMRESYGSAAQKWLCLPRVLQAYAAFLQRFDSKAFVLAGLSWIEAALRSYNDYHWRDGIEGPLVEFLKAAWKRYGAEIVSTPAAKAAFNGVLTQLVSRNSPSAAALRDLVARGI